MGFLGRRKGEQAEPAAEVQRASETTRAGDLSAQETFAVMMKRTVAPALRDMGFKGSGQVFTLPTPTHFATIGFQKSAYSDASDVRVTANVSAVAVSAWETARAERSYLPAKPAANTFYGSFAWQKRIGELRPDGEDLWWAIPAGADPTPVAAEIIETVRQYALPAMKDQIARA